MAIKRSLAIRLVLFAVVGGGVGWLVSYGAAMTGGGCPLTCNPSAMALMGGLTGLVMGIPESSSRSKEKK